MRARGGTTMPRGFGRGSVSSNLGKSGRSKLLEPCCGGSPKAEGIIVIGIGNIGIIGASVFGGSARGEGAIPPGRNITWAFEGTQSQDIESGEWAPVPLSLGLRKKELWMDDAGILWNHHLLSLLVRLHLLTDM